MDEEEEINKEGGRGGRQKVAKRFVCWETTGSKSCPIHPPTSPVGVLFGFLTISALNEETPYACDKQAKIITTIML